MGNESIGVGEGKESAIHSVHYLFVPADNKKLSHINIKRIILKHGNRSLRLNY